MKLAPIAAMFTFLATAFVAAQEAPKDKVLFEEKLAADKLDKGWSWVREDPKAWRIEKGTLIFRTLPGALHAKSNSSRNILLRELPKSNKPIAIEVHLDSDPKVMYEHAGLVWYVDDDNYVDVLQEVLGGDMVLLSVVERDGKPEAKFFKHEAKGIWLRLVVTGNKITAQYRATEKDKWKDVGQNDMPSKAVARVGMMTGGAPNDGTRHVRFRSFRIVELAGDK